MFPIRGKAAIWHPRAKLIFVKRTTVLQDSKAFCKELKFLWKTPDKFITTMRRKMFFAAALCCIVSAVMVSCGKDNPDTPEPEPTPDPEPEVPVTPKDTVVYAVGQEAVPGKGYYYATIWKDGKRILLSDGSYDAFCNGAYADGETIYIAGCEATGDLVDDGYYEPYHQNVGVIWKFKAGEEDKAEKTVISDGKYSTSPIAVTVADGKVYAAGFDSPDYDRRAILWTDGQPQYLTDGKTDALAYCIYSDGKDVYVGGYVQPASNKQGGIATIWKNGVAQSLTSGNTVAKVNAICIDGGKVYAAGSEKESGGRWKGVLWIDGVAQDFTDYVGTEVTGLYVKDGEYVIEGNMTETNSAKDICPYIWTSAGAQKVAETTLCQGVGLAVAGMTSMWPVTKTPAMTLSTTRSTSPTSGRTVSSRSLRSSTKTTSPSGVSSAPMLKRSNLSEYPNSGWPGELLRPVFILGNYVGWKYPAHHSIATASLGYYIGD